MSDTSMSFMHPQPFSLNISISLSVNQYGVKIKVLLLNSEGICPDIIHHGINKEPQMEKPSVEQIKQIVRNVTESDDPLVHRATIEK